MKVALCHVHRQLSSAPAAALLRPPAGSSAQRVLLHALTQQLLLQLRLRACTAEHSMSRNAPLQLGPRSMPCADHFLDVSQEAAVWRPDPLKPLGLAKQLAGSPRKSVCSSSGSQDLAALSHLRSNLQSGPAYSAVWSCTHPPFASQGPKPVRARVQACVLVMCRLLLQLRCGWATPPSKLSQWGLPALANGCLAGQGQLRVCDRS